MTASSIRTTHKKDRNHGTKGQDSRSDRSLSGMRRLRKCHV